MCSSTVFLRVYTVFLCLVSLFCGLVRSLPLEFYRVWKLIKSKLILDTAATKLLSHYIISHFVIFLYFFLRVRKIDERNEMSECWTHFALADLRIIFCSEIWAIKTLSHCCIFSPRIINSSCDFSVFYFLCSFNGESRLITFRIVVAAITVQRNLSLLIKLNYIHKYNKT